MADKILRISLNIISHIINETIVQVIHGSFAPSAETIYGQGGFSAADKRNGVHADGDGWKENYLI